MFHPEQFARGLKEKGDQELVEMMARSDQYVAEAIELIQAEVRLRNIDAGEFAQKVAEQKAVDGKAVAEAGNASNDTAWNNAEQVFYLAGGLILGIPATVGLALLRVILGKDREIEPTPRQRLVLLLLFVMVVVFVGFLVVYLAHTQNGTGIE